MSDAAPEPLFSLDACDGRITTLNRAFTELTGWPNDSWIGQPLTPLIHPADLTVTFAALDQTLAGETPPPINVRLRAVKGEHRQVELTLSPLEMAGAVTHLRGSIRTREAPPTGRSMNAPRDGHHPVGLADAWLPVLLAEGEVIRGKLARIAADPDDRLAQLSENEADCQTFFELLATLADVVRLKEGRAELENHPFHLLDQLGELLKDARATATARQQTLRSQLPTATPFLLLGDSLRLRRLVSTALTCAAGQDKGAIELTVEIGEIEPQCYEMRLTIDALATAGENGRSSSAELARLAMALCRELCRLLNGELSSSSEPARVLTLALTFEVAAVNTPHKNAVTTGQTIDEPTLSLPVETPKPRILAAEDQIVQQKILSLMLDRMGYQVDLVTNGLDALDALARKPYDIVMVSLELPELDGLATSRSIRQRWPEDRRPWIIAMCDRPLPPEERRLLDDTVAKPLVKVELQAALERYADHQRTVAKSGAKQTVEVEAIDFHALRQLYELQAEKVRRLVENFLTHGKQQVENLQSAARRRNAAELQSIAHSLKGSSSTLGAVRLATLCLALEQRAKSGLLDDAEDELDQLGQAFADVESGFRDKLARWDAASS